MASGNPSRRPGGRTARNTEAVQAATIDVLVDHGLAGFTVAEVAARANVHQSTIHRRWGGRENLVLDALLGAVEVAVPVPDTGSVHDDVRILLEELVGFYATPLGVVVGGLSMARLSDLGAEAVRKEMWRRRIDDVSSIISRAVERRELPPWTDPVAAIELLLAPIHLRFITLGLPPEHCDIPGTTAIVLAGIGAAGEAPPSRA